jgi:hypothetical protein
VIGEASGGLKSLIHEEITATLLYLYKRRNFAAHISILFLKAKIQQQQQTQKATYYHNYKLSTQLNHGG